MLGVGNKLSIYLSSIYLPIYLSIYLSSIYLSIVYLPIYLCICLSVYCLSIVYLSSTYLSSVHLSTYLSTYLPIVYLYVYRLSIYLSFYLPIYCLSIYVSTYLSIVCLSIYLSIYHLCVLYHNCSFQALGADLPGPHTACTLTTFLLCSFVHGCPSAWLLASLDGAFPAQHPLSPPTGSSSIQGKNWQEGVRTTLFRLSPTKCLLWKMDCQPVSNICFLVTFFMYVIRCIQRIFTHCPFLIMIPPVQWRKMFPPHNSPYLKQQTKLQPEALSCTRWHLHSESPLSFLA